MKPASVAMLLALAPAAAGCSEVLEDRASASATGAGSGAGGHGGGVAGTSVGGGGAASGGGGSGGAAPGDAPWQITTPYQGGGSAVAVDAEGNVVVAGLFGGTLDLGGEVLTSGPKWPSLFVAKLDGAGHFLWVRSFPDVDSFGMAVDGSGDVLLTGGFLETIDLGGGPLTSAGSRDLFVAKLDPAGEHVYSESFGDDQPQSASGIAVGAGGEVYVAGTFAGSFAIGGATLTSDGNSATFVAALDPDGGPIWAEAFADVGDYVTTRIAASPDGEIAVTGPYTGTEMPDLGGGPLPATGPDAAFLLRLDGSGGYLDSEGYNCRSIAPAFDSASNLHVGCAFTGDVDFGSGPLSSGYFIHLAIATFDVPHHLLGTEVFGQVGTTVYDVGLSPAGSGAILVAGRASGSLDLGGGDLLGGSSVGGFLGELDPSGQHLWSRGLGGSGNVDRIAACAAPSGDAIATGTFDGTVDLVDGPTTAPAATGLFLMKVVP